MILLSPSKLFLSRPEQSHCMTPHGHSTIAPYYLRKISKKVPGDSVVEMKFGPEPGEAKNKNMGSFETPQLTLRSMFVQLNGHSNWTLLASQNCKFGFGIFLFPISDSQINTMAVRLVTVHSLYCLGPLLFFG
jgi:hypothetical protein